MGCVMWFCIVIFAIIDIFVYTDDSYGFDIEGNILWYPPYPCYFPAKQMRLLQAWDTISLPHDQLKQKYGPVLTIIGFEVDPNLMKVSMTDSAHSELIAALCAFAHTAHGDTCRSLREFQQLAGWVNWTLNVYPLLKPQLSSMYAEMYSKLDSFAHLWVSQSVTHDLHWLADHLERSSGVYFFKSVGLDT